MKDEVWSIRKMREERKLSPTRNSYKLSDEEGLGQYNDLDVQNKRASLMEKLEKYFTQFIED